VGAVSSSETFTIINTGGAGFTGSVLPAVVSSNPNDTFSSSFMDGNLVISTNNSRLVSLADNPNAQAIATVLANISSTAQGADMAAVRSILQSLPDAQITAAYNTMGPIVDGGIRDNTTASMNNFIGATLDRVHTVLSRQDIINAALDRVDAGFSREDIISAALDKVEGVSGPGNSDETGVSAGDASASDGLWAKPYGSYLSQGTRQGIQGYDALNGGTVVGYDHMVTDNLTLGASAGYAYGKVNSDANDAGTDINSGQGAIYAGYQDPSRNYFINGAGSLAWNWYNGQRNITVGPTINRTAEATYNGQQFGTYVEGGTDINLQNNVKITPLASLQWTHLAIGGYTESNAEDLDLKVNRQDYDLLESGLGAGVSYSEKYDWGTFTREFHTKWLYDFVDDGMSVTANFVGGGASFVNNGASPARSGADLGGKLSFDFKKDLSLIAAFDAELKDGFVGLYGSGTVRYKF
jgi:uncharacterized protein with beta-barrel porin domain